MATDRAALPTLPSGLDAVDAAWGGLHRGETYLLVGQARAGRTSHALKIAQAMADADDGVVLVSGRDPEVLVRHADAGGFHLPAAYAADRAILLRVPSAEALAALGDSGLAYALEDLAGLIRIHQPAGVVVDDFTAFLRFEKFGLFAEAFRILVASAAESKATLVLALGEPANETSEQLLAFLQRQTTGTIRLALDDSGNLLTTLRPSRCNFEKADRIASQPKGHGAVPLEREGPGDTEAVPADDPTATAPPEGDSFADLPGSDGLSADLGTALPDLASSFFTDLLSDEHTAEMPAPSPAPSDLELPQSPTEEAPPPAPESPAEDDSPDWATIAPVDPDDASLVPREPDPFAAPTRERDLIASGHFLDSNRAGDAAPDPASFSGDGLAGSSAAVHAAAYPELFVHEPANGAQEALPSEPSDDPAEAFLRRLDAAFAMREVNPFLILGLRLDPSGPFADLFAVIADALYAEIQPQGALYGDGDTGALVALLPDANEAAARPLFAAVKTRLLDLVPNRTDDVLAAVQAMVVPNGAPFDTAEALFRYTLGSDG